jgi:hypothetical protein
MTAHYLRCPGCFKRGVTLRMPNGGDCYVCRYCGWNAYAEGEGVDATRRGELFQMQTEIAWKARQST